MLRWAEVFLKIWAICLATFFVINVKRELISSNMDVVASPLHSGDSHRTHGLGMSATMLVNILLKKVAYLENEVNFYKDFKICELEAFMFYSLFGKMERVGQSFSKEKLPEVKHLGNGDKVRCMYIIKSSQFNSDLV